MIAGYHVSTPAIDIHTIGAGGGTIAGVDAAGMLYVGPGGAGANPGPACYGLGGTEPTVTDAQLVLGRLRPGAYAGTGLVLDLETARDAIEKRVAQPLGITVEDAAAGIIRVLEQNLLHAVEYISIERGHAPRRFTLVAAGGAGPMHGQASRAGSAASGCTCRAMPVRCAPSACCTRTSARIFRAFSEATSTRFDPRGSTESSRGSPIRRSLPCAPKVSPRQVTLERAIDLHYRGQLWSVRVPLTVRPLRCDASAPRLSRRNISACMVTCSRTATSWPRRCAWPLAHRPGTPEVRSDGEPAAHRSALPMRSGSVWHDEHGWLETADLGRSKSWRGRPPRRPGRDRGAHHDGSARPRRQARRRYDGQLHDRGGAQDAKAAPTPTVHEHTVVAPRAAPGARSRHSRPHAEPAGSDLAPHGLGDDPDRAQPDLQPEPRLLMLHHRPRRHLDRQCRRHSDPYRRRWVCGARPAARFRRPHQSRGRLHPVGSLRRGRKSSAGLGDRPADLRRGPRARSGLRASAATARTSPTSAADSPAPTIPRRPRSGTRASGFPS